MSLRDQIENEQKEREEECRQKLKEYHGKMTGSNQWRTVCGVEFSHEESTEAADFNDMLVSFGYPDEELFNFMKEPKILNNVGARLVIAGRLPLDQIGKMMMTEKDSRIISVLKARSQGDRQTQNGRKSIILLGEQVV